MCWSPTTSSIGAAAEAFAADPALQNVMENAGVAGAPRIEIFELVEPSDALEEGGQQPAFLGVSRRRAGR